MLHVAQLGRVAAKQAVIAAHRQRSPVLVTGTTGGGGASSASSPRPASAAASSRSSSIPEKPSTSKSTTASSRMRAISAASSASSQPEFSAIWLSAIRRARACAGREMTEPQHRHGGQPELLRGHDAAVAGDQHALGVDQHRVHEAELGDGGGDLRHLRRGMGARVLGIGHEGCDRQAAHHEIRLHRR